MGIAAALIALRPDKFVMTAFAEATREVRCKIECVELDGSPRIECKDDATEGDRASIERAWEINRGLHAAMEKCPQ